MSDMKQGYETFFAMRHTANVTKLPESWLGLSQGHRGHASNTQHKTCAQELGSMRTEKNVCATSGIVYRKFFFSSHRCLFPVPSNDEFTFSHFQGASP